MPESLLTLLKLCVIALLYLFFLRVLRAVWAEVRIPVAPAAGAPPPPAPRRARQAARPPRSDKPGRGTKREPTLTVVEPAERAGAAWKVDGELTLGRAKGCQITLEDSYVSTMHARVFARDGDVYIEDLGSTNGTYVNRKRVSAPVVVRRGDRIQVGQIVMELT